MKRLKAELFRLEPKIDLLHDLLGFGRFAEVTRTADGFYLGRKRGDIGFNDFLGHPTQIAVDRTRQLFRKLDPESQTKVLFFFHKRGYPTEFLLEKEEQSVRALDRRTHSIS